MPIQLVLGELTFEGLELPERLPFAVGQSLAVQTLIGGARVVDAMGRDDKPLEWSGYFLGANALDRAQYLHTMCAQGQALTLSWDNLNYLVIIESFEPSYEFAYRIPYRISCTVVQDNTSPVSVPADSGIDDQMSGDLTSAVGLAALVGNANLTNLVGNIGAALTAAGTLTNAGNATLISVLNPINAAQSATSALLNTAETSFSASLNGSVGGVAVGVSVAQMIASLNNQSSYCGSEPSLLSLGSVLGRMAANVNSVRSNATQVTAAGASLYDVAAQQYGDPNSWTAIAKANGLSDPEVSGINTLIVPTEPDTAGGVLGG